MITVRRYTNTDKVIWDNFVASAKNATFLFQRDFIDYHKDRFEDFSLLCFKDDKLLAILPANKKGTALYSHQGLTYGGLVVQEKLKFSSFLKILLNILDFLKGLKINEFYIKQLPEMYSSVSSEEMEYLHFILKSELVRTDISSSMVLEKKYNYSKDRISGIKRGEKNGLVVKEVNEFKEFWGEILIPNLSIKHHVKPTHSLEEISLLKDKFPKNIRQFNVYKNDKIIGGTTIFETKKVVHSQYISANKEKNILGTLDYLHHELFTKVFTDGKVFDFGISNENNGQNVNEGLLYWKEGFGARAQVYKQYKIAISNKELLKAVLI